MENIKIRNLSGILFSLRQNGEMSISRLAEVTKIGLTTVKKYVEAGTESGMFLPGEIAASTGGRKARQYLLNKTYQHFLLIAVDNDELHFRVLDFALSTASSGIEKFKLSEYTAALEKIIDASKSRFPSLGTVCLSVPCIVKDGKITEWYYNRGLNGFDLRAYFEEKYKMNIVVQNNMKLSALGKIGGSSNAKQTLATVQFGHDGIGAALVYNGEIIEGMNGFAGEVSFLSHDLEDETNHRFLSEIVNSIIVFINPEKIVFYSSEVKNDFERIFSEAIANLPEYAIPEYEVSDSYLDDIFSGLLECVNRNGYFQLR